MELLKRRSGFVDIHHAFCEHASGKDQCIAGTLEHPLTYPAKTATHQTGRANDTAREKSQLEGWQCVETKKLTRDFGICQP